MSAKQKLAKAYSFDPALDQGSKKTFRPQSDKPITTIIKPIMLIFKLFVGRKISQILLFYAMRFKIYERYRLVLPILQQSKPCSDQFS